MSNEVEHKSDFLTHETGHIFRAFGNTCRTKTKDVDNHERARPPLLYTSHTESISFASLSVQVAPLSALPLVCASLLVCFVQSDIRGLFMFFFVLLLPLLMMM